MPDAHPVLDALAAVHAQGHGSFALVTTDAGRTLYAQFSADDEAPGLYAEVVGNEALALGDRLAAEQQAEMRARGWAGDGDENWSRQWPDAGTAEARQRIAFESLDALRDLFDADGEVLVEAWLDGPGAEAATAALAERGVRPPGAAVADGGARRRTMVLAAAVAFLALVLSVLLRS